ncbi:MAG: four helix bundle protein [Bergeyella zoohelcum]|nr:four helix bundle protein [Bergeyella zoohelcum]
MRNYRKYQVWELSHQLVKEVYPLTSKFPKEELFGMVSQIRRAVASIPTNIAEGCGRLTDKEFGRFIDISLGSVNETEYLLFLSAELGYLSEEEFLPFSEKINIIRQKLIQLRKKLLEQNNPQDKID